MPDRHPATPGAARPGPHATPPGGPTGAPPGTSEKLAELIARYEQGRSLWHPRDGGPTPAAAAAYPRRRGRGRQGG
jgi:hypothetical protein